MDYATKDDFRALGVMIEKLDSKVDAILEGLVSTRDELKTDMRAMEERLSLRIALLEEAVREHSLAIHALEGRTEAVEHRLDAVDHRLDAVDHRLDAVDHRLDAVDHRLDAVEQRLAALTHEVTDLRKRFDARDGRLEDLEKRVESVERELGLEPTKRER